MANRRLAESVMVEALYGPLGSSDIQLIIIEHVGRTTNCAIMQNAGIQIIEQIIRLGYVVAGGIGVSHCVGGEKIITVEPFPLDLRSFIECTKKRWKYYWTDESFGKDIFQLEITERGREYAAEVYRSRFGVPWRYPKLKPAVPRLRRKTVISLYGERGIAIPRLYPSGHPFVSLSWIRCDIDESFGLLKYYLSDYYYELSKKPAQAFGDQPLYHEKNHLPVNFFGAVLFEPSIRPSTTALIVTSLTAWTDIAHGIGKHLSRDSYSFAIPTDYKECPALFMSGYSSLTGSTRIVKLFPPIVPSSPFYFRQEGPPLPGENVAAYSKEPIRDRLTAADVIRVAHAVGCPFDSPEFWKTERSYYRITGPHKELAIEAERRRQRGGSASNRQ